MAKVTVLLYDGGDNCGDLFVGVFHSEEEADRALAPYTDTGDFYYTQDVDIGTLNGFFTKKGEKKAVHLNNGVEEA